MKLTEEQINNMAKVYGSKIKYNELSEEDKKKAQYHFAEILNQIQNYLNGQEKKVKEISNKEIVNNKKYIDDNNNNIFKKGTLVHCANECDYDKLIKIKEEGILAGDFVRNTRRAEW